jgi:hypothetical protein
MADLIHRFESEINGFTVSAYAEQRGNVWIGWLEFGPTGRGSILRTGEETSQPSREAVEYWASGLEPVYLEGALVRAR